MSFHNIYNPDPMWIFPFTLFCCGLFILALFYFGRHKEPMIGNMSAYSFYMHEREYFDCLDRGYIKMYPELKAYEKVFSGMTRAQLERGDFGDTREEFGYQAVKVAQDGEITSSWNLYAMIKISD